MDRDRNLPADKSFKGMIRIMSENQPGAIIVLMKISSLVGDKEGAKYLVILDDMNIRGNQLEWALEFCNNNYARLLAVLTPLESANKAGPAWSAQFENAFNKNNRDRAAMVAEINRRSIERGIEHRAVISGACKKGRETHNPQSPVRIHLPGIDSADDRPGT